MMDRSLPGFANARDLGGLPREDGGKTVRGAIVRAETPRQLDAEIRGRAEQFVRVIDLRSEHEAAAVPHPYFEHCGYRLRPLVDPRAEAGHPADADATLGDVYQGSLSRNAEPIAAIMREIAIAPAGTVMVACAAGKDRTGMIVALLLRLAGVTDEAICADYHHSQWRLEEYFAAELAAIADEGARERLRSRQHAEPENIKQMLDHIDHAYGSAESYLVAIGLTPDEIERLRSRLVPEGDLLPTKA
jgi:hypothetical protein